MKKIYTLCFLIGSIFLFSQYIHPSIRLKKSWDSAKTFKGQIAGQAITMHLEYYHHSGWHDKVFTVKGWYYYDRFKKKIPLMGFYNGNLMLYHFKKEGDYKKIMDKELFCWMEPCPSYSNYLEFINIKQNNLKIQKGYMLKNKRRYPLKIYTNLLDITTRNEWLYLPNGTSYNLREIIDEYGGNKIVSTYIGEKENRIMLYYERDSNFNHQGFCGADVPETGYRLLTFNQNWKIKKFQVYSTNSCLVRTNLYKEYKTKYDFIKAYSVHYNGNLNLIIVNLKNSTFGSCLIRKNYDPF